MSDGDQLTCREREREREEEREKERECERERLRFLSSLAETRSSSKEVCGRARLTLDSEVFLKQLCVLLCVELQRKSSDQQVHLDHPVPALHNVKACLVHLPQRRLKHTHTHTRRLIKELRKKSSFKTNKLFVLLNPTKEKPGVPS